MNNESLISVLARLGELPGETAQLSVLFIMTYIPTRAFAGIPLPTIQFPPYARSQLLKILSNHVPPSLYYPNVEQEAGDLPDHQLRKIWQALNTAVVDTFGSGTSLDVTTSLRLSYELWPEFVKPVIDAGALGDGIEKTGSVDPVALFQLAKRKSLFVGEDILKKQCTLNTAVQTLGLILIYLAFLADGTGTHGLPYYVNFLIIAAFLASYNASAQDARIFSHSSHKRKRRGVTQRSNKGISKVPSRKASSNQRSRNG
jgi:Origin recognition complex (ORC) subunit 5 C-terminus